MATCVFDTLFYTVFLVFTCSERDEASTDVSVAVCARAIVILFSTLSQRVTNWKWAKNYHQIVGQLCRTLVNKQLLNTYVMHSSSQYSAAEIFMDLTRMSSITPPPLRSAPSFKPLQHTYSWTHTLYVSHDLCYLLTFAMDSVIQWVNSTVRDLL